MFWEEVKRKKRQTESETAELEERNAEFQRELEMLEKSKRHLLEETENLKQQSQA